jgi:hypothetical protein
MNSIFVGSKVKPSYLVEINRKNKEIEVYVPDMHSRKEEFYERYSLGNLVLKGKYTEITFPTKPTPYKKFSHVPSMSVKIRGKVYVLSGIRRN